MEKGSTVYSFTYDPAGRPVSISDGSNRYYYVLNQQGDVIGLLNSNAEMIVMYVYDAWGRILASADLTASGIGTNNPLRYRGYVYDTETGLYYLQSRYYNPTWGRFINADDPGYMGVDGTPSSYNLFAYCGNNPVMGCDPTGRFVITAAMITGALVGGAINFVSAVVSEVVFEELTWDDGWKILASTAIGFFEGGLSVAFPGAGWAISCGAGALDSIVCDVIDGETNVGQIAVNALFSGAMGAISGSGNNDFVMGRDIINGGANAKKFLSQGGLHPKAKKAAQNACRTAKKYIWKTYKSAQRESIEYATAEGIGRIIIESILF
jgi:RHS repeat-associated protein